MSLRPGCCGRPLISQGLLEEARALAETLVESLFPIASRGEKILFCEPSCLIRGQRRCAVAAAGGAQEKARTVASACMLFEEFAADSTCRLRPGPERILLHGHCHQKSMGLLPATVALLSRIPSATVVDLDAGCCGMAGSFGYFRQHYDVSRAIASRKLLPAVKAMKPGDVLVAPGTSCRHQVAELGGVRCPPSRPTDPVAYLDLSSNRRRLLHRDRDAGRAGRARNTNLKRNGRP